MIYWILVVGMILLDQWTKYLVVTKLKPIGSFPLIENVFHLTFAKNTGAAFSILRGKQLFLVLLTSVVVLTLAYVLKKAIDDKRSVWMLISLSMIIGGAAGNLIDRIRLEYVVDFFDFTLINFAIFNVADVFICVGTALLALMVLVFKEELPNI